MNDDNFYEKLNEYGLTTKFLVKAFPKNKEEPEVLTCNYRVEEVITSLNFVKEF